MTVGYMARYECFIINIIIIKDLMPVINKVSRGKSSINNVRSGKAYYNHYMPDNTASCYHGYSCQRPVPHIRRTSSPITAYHMYQGIYPLWFLDHTKIFPPSTLCECYVSISAFANRFFKAKNYGHVPSKHDTLNQCCFNVGPASKTVAQH